MSIRFANIKKLAALAGMATAVTAAGWSLGSGTAQASPAPDPHHHVVVHVFNHIDRAFDRHFEGTAIDRVLDRVLDHK